MRTEVITVTATEHDDGKATCHISITGSDEGADQEWEVSDDVPIMLALNQLADAMIVRKMRLGWLNA